MTQEKRKDCLFRLIIIQHKEEVATNYKTDYDDNDCFDNKAV